MAPVPGSKEEPDKDHPDIRELKQDSDVPVLVVSSSESESDNDYDLEGPAEMGYQMIPQAPYHHNTDSDEDSDENVEENVVQVTAPTSHVAPDLDEMLVQHLNQDFIGGATASMSDPQSHAVTLDRSETSEIWNQPTPRQESIAMNQEHADKIRAAMSGFTLPVVNHPAWSKLIPEEEWKARLMSKTSGTKRGTQTDSHDT